MKRYLHVHGWLDSPVWGKAPYSEREAWSWMIGEAAWNIVEFPDPMTAAPVKINRGQLSASLRFMATKWGWVTEDGKPLKDKTRRFLLRLKKWKMIDFATACATDSATAQNIITICNYDKYQLLKGESATQVATEIATSPRQPRDKQETKKYNPNGLYNTPPIIPPQTRGKKSTSPQLERPLEVSETVWIDFLGLRKAKGSPLTPTALQRIEAEARKAGWSLQDALAECCARGWQGFKAEWVKDSQAKGGFGGKNREFVSKHDQARAALGLPPREAEPRDITPR